ncbi:GNAT family N-acetyltransferase [Bacillus haikouensis]|uniref:GNAT family N-acetyltransferase n=1 Tax=Bacillus haikouensis TaxID=1510468 RepID=UPI0015579061|nr:GNAT family N-acetyltransferase [Bacillus haikouensis]NQD64368.1 GNAT family N-acetyltransferase [Bacillus haikouensis]
MSYKVRQIKAVELVKLYKGEGWWEERKEEDIEEMLKQGDSVGAWNKGELIGFARAVSDGKFRAYIEDVVIHKDYQNSGTGTKLLAQLVDELSHIDIISLFCEEELLPFYEKNNFKFSKSHLVMHRK